MKRRKKPALRFKGFVNDWEQRKLGNECFEIVAGGDVDKTKLLQDGKYPVIANALTDEGIIGYYANEYRIKAPAVTVTGRGDVGHARARKINFTPVVRLLSVISKHDVDFLAEAIDQNDIVLESTGVPQLTVPALANYLLCFPPTVKEEKRIGQYFSQLNHLITLHQRKLEKLQNLKKAMLEKMFPKNGAKIPEIRFKGFTDDWEQRKLVDIATMHARIGWQNLRTSEFLDDGDYYLITGTDFKDGRIDFSSCHYVAKERYDQDKNIQIHNGSILITKDGTLGKVAYINGLNKPATLNAGVFNVVIKANDVDEKYLYHYLAGPFLMDYVSKRATGGTIKHLNQNILVDFPVVLPSYYDEQKRIGETLQDLDDLITLHQRKLEKLQNLKKAMLEKMFI